MSRTGLLHHIELYVSDLPRSTEFWGWLLTRFGYTLHQTWDSGVSWKLGDTYLVLVQTEPAFLEPPYHRKRTGLNHLAFHAASRSQVDELTRDLKQKGIPILYDEKHPTPHPQNSPYAVYFEDPDRIKIELVAE